MPERLRKKTLKVLVASADRRGGSAIRRALRRGRSRTVKVSVVASLASALRHLEAEEVDLVLLDLTVPDAGSPAAVRRIRWKAPRIPIVVVTDEETERLGIQAIQLDAQDYLLRHQLNPGTLTRVIRYALEPSWWQGQYRRLLSISPDGVMILDADGRVLFVNAAASRLLGGAPARADELPVPLRHANAEPTDITLPTRRTVEVREVDMPWSGREARLLIMRDITQRRAVERQLTEMAHKLQSANERLERIAGTDPLTKLLNRRGIEEVLGREVNRMKRTGDSFMAILIDCDDFKSVNDSYGHGVGDAALAALARSVEEALRVGDEVGRVGGDEFLVLLPSTTIAEGMVVAEKIRRAIKSTVLPLASSESIRLSASLGVAGIAREVVSVEEVLASLHAALTQSKNAGKDTVSGDDGRAPRGGGRVVPHTSRTILDPVSIPLSVAVQPIMCMDNDRSVGHEALTRGPPGVFATPSELFRTAFEQNVLTTLDLRALRANVEWLASAAWSGWYHVNLFPSTLLNTPVRQIVRLLERGSTRERLCVELSEQQFLGDPTYLRPLTSELQSAGFRIAIDDVGFGRSSVEALMLLDPDVVKVDRRCITSIATSAGNRRQLERLLAMLGAVGATVIVEGVETEEQVRVLRDLGVRYAQGFLWGEPTLTPTRPPVEPSAMARRADDVPALEGARRNVGLAPGHPPDSARRLQHH